MEDTALEDRLRLVLREKAKLFTLRELAKQIGGLSHFVLWKFLDGKSIGPKSLRRIQAYVESEQFDGAAALHQLLNRLLPEFTPGKVAVVEARVRRALTDAYAEAGVKTPQWLQSDVVVEAASSVTQSERAASKLAQPRRKAVKRGSRPTGAQ